MNKHLVVCASVIACGNYDFPPLPHQSISDMHLGQRGERDFVMLHVLGQPFLPAANGLVKLQGILAGR